MFSMNLVTWHNLGMPYLLTEHNLKENFCIEHQLSIAKPKKPYPAATKFNQNADSSSNLAKNSYVAARPQQNIKVPSHAAHENNTVNSPRINNIQPEIHTPAEKRPSPNPASLPIHSWPAVWKELLTNKNSAKVIWTYNGLGNDISGQGNPERKELVRTIIKELAFPAGTHAFWPLSLPLHEEQEMNTQIFWGAAERLEARAVVIMGSTALNAFNFPRKLRPLQQTVYNGYMIIVLPDINFLLDEMHKYPPVREFIRTALQRYVRS